MTASATPPPTVDVAVLGAGPAGIGAAVAADAAGRSVLLVDEAPAAGGQIYRKVPDTLTPARSGAGDTGPDRRVGDALRRELDDSGVRTAFGWRVWSVVRGERRFRLDGVGPGAAHAVEAKALLMATGAVERELPFPGWTTPGVFGRAAATTMLKSQRISPGRRVVVAGAGPLLAAVAAGVVKAGADAAAEQVPGGCEAGRARSHHHHIDLRRGAAVRKEWKRGEGGSAGDETASGQIVFRDHRTCSSSSSRASVTRLPESGTEPREPAHGIHPLLS